MTQRITEKNVYQYYKFLCQQTQKQFYLVHWEQGWKLFANTDKGNIELSRVLSTIEMYEVLYSMTKTIEALNGQYEYATGNIKYLNKQDSENLAKNLHNTKYIRIVQD